MSKESKILREAAAYVRQHGFSSFYKLRETNCGCFIRAIREVTGRDSLKLHDHQLPGINLLSDVIGCRFSEHELDKSGWSNYETDDAVAAIRSAADLADD